MTLYKRKWNCAVCDKPVIWDSERLTLTCSCKVQENVGFVNMEAFTPLPKYDKRIWKETVTLPLDSAKYRPVNSETLEISDRNSIFMGNENPEATLRWIYYPEGDKIQFCIAISGNRHTEKMAYNQKDLKDWKEWMWILIDGESIKKILNFLAKDPQKLESWM